MPPTDYKPPFSDWYVKQNVTPPSTASHGTDQDIRGNLRSGNARNWRMEGPGNLVADTDFGELRQTLPPNIICKGTDSKGLPILQKIGT